MAEQAMTFFAPRHAATRTPVCQVMLFDAGTPDLIRPLTGVIEAEVTNTNFYSADTFRVLVALAEAPPGFTVDYLSTQASIPLEIIMGPDAGHLVSLIQGQVDDFDYDPVENTVELRGRDYTSFFIDSRTTETWVGATASQVAVALAQRHRLDASLVTATSQKIGAGSHNVQVKTGEGRTEWDLLTALASQTLDWDGSNFVVYVTGTSLYFGPRPTEPGYFLECQPATVRGEPFRIKPAADPGQGPAWGGISLRLTRNISVLRNVAVEMRSTQTGSGITLAARYPVLPAGGGVAEQLYQFRAPVNLPLDVLARQAQARQQDITRHELRVAFTLPGDNVLRQSRLLTITGLGNRFDQSYFVQSVTRRFSSDGGYTMEGTAQNRNEPDGLAV
jgi:phage protein D